MPSLLNHKFTIIGLFSSIFLAGMMYVAIKDNTKDKVSSEKNNITDEFITLFNQQRIQIIHTENPKKGLIIFVADKNSSETNKVVSKKFAELSYYVAIVDNQNILNPKETYQCLDLAKELTVLSHQILARLSLNNSDLPILVGAENSGASVYAALAQTDKKTFHAAVSINLIPELDTHAALCKEEIFTVNTNGTIKLKGVNHLPTSFYIFQDDALPINPTAIEFANSISNVKFNIAKEKNQTSLSEAIQILQWLDPRLADQNSSDANNSNLPLIEVNTTQSQSAKTQTLAIMLTGDGGWAEIDKQVSKRLAAQGIPTLGFDSLSYFWNKRTPEETSAAIEGVITQYLGKWEKQQVILIGYSFGADVLPFIANSLSPEIQQKISLIALLGMSETAAFEFHLSSWMNSDNDKNRLPLLPEIKKMKWANSVCVYGTSDNAARCLPAATYGVKVIAMKGDHHFDKKYDELIEHILAHQKKQH